MPRADSLSEVTARARTRGVRDRPILALLRTIERIYDCRVVTYDFTQALQYALAAAAHGLPVIPLSRSKLPAIRSSHRDDPGPPVPCRGECGRLGHGVHDAIADPAGVRELFAAAPWATGYGVACGRPPHHLIGLDLDRKGAVDGVRELTLLAAARDFRVPATRTVLTPSGGRHLWLSGPQGVTVPNSVRRIAPGIDVRGAGGYVVGPGSRGRTGRYRWAPGTAWLPPAPVPPELLRLILPPPAPSLAPARRAAPRLAPSDRVRPTASGGRAVRDRARRAAGRTPSAGLVGFVLASLPGERNERLFWAACRAYETGRGDVLADALTEAAVRVGLPLREARATVASAARHTARGA